jgi:TldD protein
MKMITSYSRKTILTGLIAALLGMATFAYAQQAGDVLFKAMQDELDRSMSQLVMENLERPYFISYTIDDAQQLEVHADLGTLTQSNLDRGRYLTIDLRVGNYSLDNSNFVSGFSGIGASYTQLPIDNNYDALRNQIYLETDQAYKAALETISKKRAYLQTRVITNRPDDFLKLPTNRILDRPEEFDLSKAKFEELAKAATVVFRDYPDIVSSDLRIQAAISNQYLLNSNGTRALRGDRIYIFDLSMMGKAPDGEDIFDGDRIVYNSLATIPSVGDLTAWAKSNADRMSKLIKADTLEEYIGPVIFTADAAGEFFRQLFVRGISNLPQPTYENEQMAAMIGRMGGGGGDFAEKLNRRVLPASFTVYDDPTVSKVGNSSVIGGYNVDDAGNTPQKIVLVESGKLINLLIGIAPTKKIKDANGHARGAVSKAVTAKPSNLVFESSEKVPYAKLKGTLITLCKDVDLPYGLIVKRLSDPNASGGSVAMRLGNMMMRAGGSGGPSLLSSPWEIYKVYPDGREEPVRGLQFNNVTVRILKDILQTDDQSFVYNFLLSDDQEMPASIVTPSVLVEEMELKKSEEKIMKPPLLPSPLAGK